jgi:hypothetical protein
MTPETLSELRDKMTSELELLYNQAQRRGSRAPSPSQIVDTLFTVAVSVMAAAQPGVRNRKLPKDDTQ